MKLNIYCPLCDSATPESQVRLRELARLGMARFLKLALAAGVSISPEQQTTIFDALLGWDTVGLPGPADFMVHEHANRALWYADMDASDERLGVAAATMPAWDSEAWNCAAEVRIAEQLADAEGA